MRLGSFKEKSDAIAARKQAEERYSVKSRKYRTIEEKKKLALLIQEMTP